MCLWLWGMGKLNGFSTSVQCKQEQLIPGESAKLFVSFSYLSFSFMYN